MIRPEIPPEGDPVDPRAVEAERQALERRLQAAEDVERAEGRWIDRGIQDVPVRDLPAPEGIGGPEDFQKTSHAEMVDGYDKLRTMQPYIASGEGANRDYWAHVDRHYGVEYADGYQRVYEAFYGDDAIRLTKDGDRYDIINGRHRIRVAQELGLPTVPARVIERHRGG